MSEWLSDLLHSDVKVEPGVLLFRLAAAFVLGCVVAGVYRLTSRPGNGTGMLGTFVLLSVLIALVTVVIGNSWARAFSLVGVLGIVRFRTVMEDTRDTAFIMAAVASGMACGAGYLVGPLLATPFVFLAAWLFRPRVAPVGEPEQRLRLRLAAVGTTDREVQALLRGRLPGCRLAALATARGGAALDVTYIIRPLSPDEALALVAELNRIEGVQEVELRGD
jgi:uncharacterized membrane protein YhiD involved in acid resistance